MTEQEAIQKFHSLRASFSALGLEFDVSGEEFHLEKEVGDVSTEIAEFEDLGEAEAFLRGFNYGRNGA